jgi:hypothetical protein
MYFKNIYEKDIYSFSKFKLDIWNLYILLKHQSLNIHDLIGIFKALQERLKF